MSGLSEKIWILTKKENDDILSFKSGTNQDLIKNYAFKLTDDNILIEFSISNGQLTTKTGSYKLEGNSLKFYFQNSYYDSEFKIIGYDNDNLKLKKAF